MEKIKKILSCKTISYGICSLTTVLINILIFKLLFVSFDIDYVIANIIAVILSKVFSFLVNKFFVFKCRCKNRKELVVEVSKYILTRFCTSLIDILGMMLLVELFNINQITAKCMLQVIIIVLNYILAKNVVFKGAKNSSVQEKVQCSERI